MVVAAITLAFLIFVAWGAYLYITKDKAATHSTLKQANLAPVIPVNAFFANTKADWSHRVSFDGNYIAYLGSEWGKTVVYVRRTEKATVLCKVKLKNTQGFYWARDTHCIRILSDNRLWEVDVTNSGREQWIDVTPRGFKQWSLLMRATEDPGGSNTGNMIVTSIDRDPKLIDLFSVRKDGGGKRLLVKNQGKTIGWLLDKQGAPRIQLDRNAEEGVDIFLLGNFSDAVLQNDAFSRNDARLLKSIAESDTFNFIHHFDENLPLLAISNVGRDKLAIVEVDKASGDETVIDQHEKVDVGRCWGFDISDTRVDLACYFDGYPQLSALSARGEVVKTLIESQGEYVDVDGLASSADGRFVMAALSVNERSYQHYLLDLELETSTRIYDNSFRKYNAALNTTKPLSFIATDGTDIPVLLTLPKGAAETNLPAIVVVHGGPASRNIWQFNQMTQLLANRGYAVLRVNFRGSTGYGKAFQSLGFRNFGTTMQSDVTDAANWLVAQSIADKNSLAIVGVSYGGYSSALAMTRDAGLFSAGVAECAVTDFVYQMDNNPHSWGLRGNAMKRYIGDPENAEHRAIMKERSPITHAENAQDPILLIHGKRDPIVGFEQTEEFERALLKAGKTVQSHYPEKMGHGYNRWQDRVLRARLLEEFLAEHLGGRSGGRNWAELAARYL